MQANQGVVSEEETREMLDQAVELMEQHKLPKAERLLHTVLTSLPSDSAQTHSKCVVALSTLANIYLKRSRSSRHSETEWYTMYLVAMGLEQLVVHHSEIAQRLQPDNAKNKELKEQRTRAFNHLRVMEEKVVHLIEERLLAHGPVGGHTILPGSASSLSLSRVPASGSSFSLSSVPASASSFSLSSCQGGMDAWEQQQQHKKQQAKPPIDINRTWLDNLHESCLGRVKQLEKHAEWLEQSETPTWKSVPEVSSPTDETSENPKQPFSFGLRVDFKRVQKVIQKLVKQISHDLRQRYTRTRLPEEMLRQSMSTEMLSMLYPDREPSDIVSLFEQALREESSSPSLEDAETAVETEIEQGDHKSCVASEKSLSEISTPWSCQTSNGQNSPVHYRLQSENTSDDSDQEHTLTCLTKTGFREKQASYDFPGVLTVWKGMKSCRSNYIPPSTSSFVLQTYEELSPLTEIGNCLCQKHVSDNVDDHRLYPTSPLNKDMFNCTFAHILTKVGDNFKDAKRDSMALELYTYVLGVYQGMGTCTAHQSHKHPASHLPSVAHVLQNIGMMRCNKGDVVGGTHLLEKAMSLHEASGASEDSMGCHLAQLWLLLGNTLLGDRQGEGVVFEHVMQMIQEVLEADWHTCPEEENMVDVDSDSSDSDSDSGDVYCVNLSEAMSCYSHALAILQKLRRQKRHGSQSPENQEYNSQTNFTQEDELHNCLYGDVLTRLADCSLVKGAFNKAVLCYEEALFLFRNSLGPTTLQNNAHVLVMLGMANFLLANYSKAVSMLETAHVLHQHLHADRTNLEMAFTLTMLGLAHNVQGQYYKSVAWCLKAFDCYRLLYDRKLLSVDILHRWFVVQTVYVLGFSYYTLNLCDKALNYLGMCEDILLRCPDDKMDAKQLVRVLKIKADVHIQQEDRDHALLDCQRALDYCGTLGNEKSANALQNQLLNCMADLHITSHEYSVAALYLEQALTYQKTVEKSINGDLTDIVMQLAQTYTLSGDLDRAIQCYMECYETFRELSHPPVQVLTDLLGHMATLCHVKACIQDDDDGMNTFLQEAEDHYQSAVNINPRCAATSMYANYLYQQGRPADALLVLIPLVYDLSADYQHVSKMLWYGVQQAVLPDQVQLEIDDLDEATIDTHIFSCFLAVLCCNQLKLHEDGTEALLKLFHLVSPSLMPLNHSLLGYALLELGLHLEASESFFHAAQMQPDNEVSLYNAWMCLGLAIYTSFTLNVIAVLKNILAIRHDLSPISPKLSTKQIRDSGYYENNSADETPCTVTVSLSPSTMPNEDIGYADVVGIDGTEIYTSVDTVDQGYTSTDNLGIAMDDIVEGVADEEADASVTFTLNINGACTNYENELINIPVRQSPPDCTSTSSETEAEWVFEEEVVVETHPNVLAMLKGELESDKEMDFTDVGAESEWVVEDEEVVETPEAVLAVLQGQAESEWIFDEEEVVETPQAVLAAMLKNTQEGGASQETFTLTTTTGKSTHIAHNKTVSQTEWENKPAERFEHQELIRNDYVAGEAYMYDAEYKHKERVYTQCTEIIDNKNTSQQSQRWGEESEQDLDTELRCEHIEESWIEETVETPAALLALLRDQRNDNDSIDSQKYNVVVEPNGNDRNLRTETCLMEQNIFSSDMDSTVNQGEAEDTWEVWEETVETPKEVIQAILSKRNC